MRKIVFVVAALGLASCNVPTKPSGDSGASSSSTPAPEKVATPWPAGGYVESCKALCGEAPKRIAIAPLDVEGVNVNAVVTLTNDYVTAPEMTDAMGMAIGRTALQLQYGNVKSLPETQWVQFQIGSKAEHGSDTHDLANIRVPLAAVMAAKGEEDHHKYLDLADTFELGTDGAADGKTERLYCDSHRKDSPHFCGLVDAALLGR